MVVEIKCLFIIFFLIVPPGLFVATRGKLAIYLHRHRLSVDGANHIYSSRNVSKKYVRDCPVGCLCILHINAKPPIINIVKQT